MSASDRQALRSICVFCGSQSGVRDTYTTAARALGTELAQRGVEIIFGGGHVGLMGALADAALQAGGRVVGIIPQHLMTPEVAHQGLTELCVVDSMHARKQLMAARADAFIALPGGYGTFEELFEIITWLQLGLHAKAIGAVNISGFFDPLLALIQHAAQEGFIRPAHWDLLMIEPSVGVLLERLSLHGSALRRAHPPTGSIQQG